MTQNNLQFVDQICQRMLAYNLVRTQAEFSQIWLEQAGSYLSSSKTRSRKVSDQVVQRLFEKLTTRLETYNSQANHMMGVQIWRRAYQNTMILQLDVQHYLTWKASAGHAAPYANARSNAIHQQISQQLSGPSAAPAHASLAKIIEFALPKKY